MRMTRCAPFIRHFHLRSSLGSRNDAVAKTFSEKIAALEDPQRRFNYEHQQAISLTNIPQYAPKDVKEIAEARPWDGEENPINASRRMLDDAIKPMKISRPQRLSNAREAALDYQLNEAEGPTHKERLVSSKKNRRQFGAGRGGRASSGLSSGGWIESIASQEIENAVARGQFANIERGEGALDNKDGLIISSRNPDLDFSEYLMNNIIKKQGGAPPWIMKQQAVRERIASFREQIRRRLQERLVHKLSELTNYDVKMAVELATRGTHNKDEEWETQYALFHREAVNDINSQIRGYNLQAPPSARRGYLDVESEISRCYATVADGIEDRLARFAGLASIPKADKSKLHSSIPPLESPDKHYGLRQLFRDLFSR